MKKALGFSFLIFVALLLSACGNAVTPTASDSMQEIYTAVAETLSAPATAVSVTPTATLLPTVTLLPTATLYVYPTASPTSTYVWYSYSSTYYGTNYGCYDAAYVKDMTIPDGTFLTPGETFVKTWKLQNTGSCTWTNGFPIVFVSGYDMDGSDTEIDQTVYANKKAEISISLTAPDDEGTYTGYWQMSDEYGDLFGELVSVEIVVVEPTVTSTPTATLTYTMTPTATLTLTATSTPTMTSVSTSTSTPTATWTYTITPTAINTSTPTSVSTKTLTPIPTVIPTDTPVPTSTSTPTAIWTYTTTPTVTSTPTSVPTETLTPVPTVIPTDTLVPTSTPDD